MKLLFKLYQKLSYDHLYLAVRRLVRPSIEQSVYHYYKSIIYQERCIATLQSVGLVICPSINRVIEINKILTFISFIVQHDTNRASNREYKNKSSRREYSLVQRECD